MGGAREREEAEEVEEDLVASVQESSARKHEGLGHQVLDAEEVAEEELVLVGVGPEAAGEGGGGAEEEEEEVREDDELEDEIARCEALHELVSLQV